MTQNRTTKPRLRSAFLLAAFVLPACTGSIAGREGASSHNPADDDAEGAGKGGAGQGGEAADPPISPAPPTCAQDAGAPAAARRLVRLRWPEYQAVVRQTFGIAAYRVSGSVPQDPFVEFYGNNANALRVPTYAAARVYLDEADEVLAAVRDWTVVLKAHGGCATVEDVCAKKALTPLAASLFRRPLSQDETAWVASRYDDFRQKVPAADAVRALAKLLLNHPSFLYRFEGVEVVSAKSELSLGTWEAASALSFTLTGAPPDQTLWSAAETGKLATVPEVRAQIRRLLGRVSQPSPMLGEFANSWLVSEPVSEKSLGVDKRIIDPAVLPSLLQAELGRTFANLVLESKASFIDLMTSPTTISTGQLSAAYKYPLQGEAWSLFDGSAHHRVGLLASPAFLAARGAPSFGRLIYRGVFTLRRLFCFDPGDPVGIDVDQAVLDAKLPEGLSDREQLERVTGAPACQGCHAPINAIGAAMDAYDSAGRHNEVTGRAAPDTRVTLPMALLGGGVVNGLEELAQTIARNDAAGACFSEHLGRYLAQGDLSEPQLCRVRAAFEGKGLNAVPVADLLETTLLVLLTTPRQ
ncbi:MAG: DUF1592 domain-containing protein [Deltaproteobacteria bacterium]|nr:DUF1592 domain-containing protein [Deltaproteobacteria bacterium]